ncbi:hypothetical protein TPA0907_51560 [Micromonospora humidisoli]|nr:hypothetical protein TPA0907_51560 [Micromonospora sp. AKA109]
MTAHPPRRTWRDVLTRPARRRVRGDRAVVPAPRPGYPDGMVGRPAGRHRDDVSVDRAAGRTRGSVSVEVAVLAPAFLALLMLAGVAGRVAVADEAVEAAAHDAARAASIARDAGTAESAARSAARRQLDWRGLNCASAPQVTVWGSTRNSDHTSLSTAFRQQLGEPVSIWVQVSCTVSFAGMRFPGLPMGDKRVEATFGSPLDRYRSRQ